MAFASIRQSGVYVRAATSSGSEEPLIRSGPSKFVSDWSGDGRFLLYTEAKKGLDILALPDPLASGARQPVVFADTAFNETQGQFSPDSRWVAYASDESGRYEIYVRPFPPDRDHGGQALVSTGGGVQPRWRGDGKELFYLSTDHKLMAVNVKTEPTFESATPHPLFETSAQAYGTSNAVFRYAVTKDGNRFLMLGSQRGHQFDCYDSSAELAGGVEEISESPTRCEYRFTSLPSIIRTHSNASIAGTFMRPSLAKIRQPVDCAPPLLSSSGSRAIRTVGV